MNKKWITLMTKSSIENFKWEKNQMKRSFHRLAVAVHRSQLNVYQVKINTSPIHACSWKCFCTKRNTENIWHFSQTFTVIRFRRHVETDTNWTFHIGIVTHAHIAMHMHTVSHWLTHEHSRNETSTVGRKVSMAPYI